MSGGGSGVGLAALVKGTVDIANASRDIKPDEIEQAKKNTGKEPKGFIVGYRRPRRLRPQGQPADELTLEQLAEIYGEGGKVTRWSELGVKIPGVSDDTIVRVSRQSSSGTYEFLREHVLGNRDFKLGLARPERLEGSRGTGGVDADRDRLQRHGLRDAGGQEAEARRQAGRPGRRGLRRASVHDQERIRSPGRSTCTRSASRRAR